MKRFLCFILCFVLAFGTVCTVTAEGSEDEMSEEDLREMEEDAEMTDEEQQELEEEEKEASDDEATVIEGPVYHEKTKEDFNVNSPALYTGKMRSDFGGVIWSEKTTESKKVLDCKGKKVDILYVGLRWMIVRREKKIGYVKREYISLSTIETVDPVNTPPMNVQKHAYIATAATECHVRKSMIAAKGSGDDGNNWVILKPGTQITIWQFYEGWAMVNYMREYGYIDPNELTDLKPVSPTDEEIFSDCPIAAYTSYYKMAQTEMNLNRIHNIKMGCGYISREVGPGEIFDANKIMGKYNASKGYRQAGVLIDGKTVAGYGGGTCQVSSTLYNVILQLPQIKILYRHAHGGNGASYLPIHCDAAVGNAKLNLRFRNDYDFTIRIEALSNDDGALSIRIYKAE